MRITLLSCLAAWVLLSQPAEAGAQQTERAEVLRFERDVLPILEQNCLGCHGPKRPRAGLRLDLREHALLGGNSGLAALLPGQSDASEILRRLRSEDLDERMPPEDKAPLSAAQIEILARWIDQGAPYASSESAPPEATELDATSGEHWSYVAPVRAALPAGGSERAPNAIDRFITHVLNGKGMAQAPRAERWTLARRLSLDLTGLPLSQAQMDQYALDTEPGAYERLMDRLLDSNHFGERWGRHWLDLARYSDSDGGGMDVKRSIWPYRDWVIEALNRNMPFDQFTIEQMAGDLLDKPTRPQQVATGFFRNTVIQQEGGADDEEYRIEAVKLRVQTTGEVWMGSTLMCAQCHDHKFDPTSQRDYYQLYAAFNQTQDGGRSNDPLLDLPTPAQERQLAELDAALMAVDERIETSARELDEGLSAWEANYLAELPKWIALQPTQMVASPGVELSVEPDGSILAGADSPPRARYTIGARAPLQRISAIRLQVLPDERLPYGGPGRGFNGQFVLTNIELAYAALGQALQKVRLVSPLADRAGEYFPVEAALDGKFDSGWGFNNQTGTPHEAIFLLEEPIAANSAAELELSILLEHGAELQRSLGRFKLFVCDASVAPTPRPYDFDIEAVLSRPPAERSEKESAALRAHYLRVSPELGALRQERARLVAARPIPHTTLVMRAVAEERESFVHLRGNFLTEGARVQPGTPDFLPSLGLENERFSRLDLARWLVHRDNPLTARVVVNRWWQRLFGRGLVDTEADFGLRGSLPSHPELLDWLAVELMESGWNMKAMLRLMLSSATYCQSSVPGAQDLDLDPLNRLLSHQNRLRLEGEAIRDSALLASGALNPLVGGPSMHPPLPDFISVRAMAEAWPSDKTEVRFRRGLYTWHWRTSPYPFLTLFDGPDATVSCTRRGQANNALQALALANDPMIFELAQELARRILKSEPQSLEAGIESAFRWCIGRAPSADELGLLREFYGSQLASFQNDPQSAQQAAPAKLEADLNVAQAAAWTALARVLFNLDEFITRT